MTVAISEPSPSYDPDWPEETAQLAYDAAQQMEPAYLQWADSIDGKVVGIFAVAAVILTLAPSFHYPGTATILRALWADAIICFLGAAWNCYHAYAPRGFRVGPDPKTLRCQEWLALRPSKHRYRTLRFMGETYTFNQVSWM